MKYCMNQRRKRETCLWIVLCMFRNSISNFSDNFIYHMTRLIRCLSDLFNDLRKKYDVGFCRWLQSFTQLFSNRFIGDVGTILHWLSIVSHILTILCQHQHLTAMQIFTGANDRQTELPAYETNPVTSVLYPPAIIPTIVLPQRRLRSERGRGWTEQNSVSTKTRPPCR